MLVSRCQGAQDLSPEWLQAVRDENSQTTEILCELSRERHEVQLNCNFTRTQQHHRSIKGARFRQLKEEGKRSLWRAERLLIIDGYNIHPSQQQFDRMRFVT